MAQIVTSTRFRFMFRAVRGGHRFFEDTTTGKIAVADESGDTHNAWGTPDMTEDGVLFLDKTRPIQVSMSRGDGEYSTQHISLPLVRESDGELTSTPIGIVEALHYARRFGMNIATPVDEYTVSR